MRRKCECLTVLTWLASGRVSPWWGREAAVVLRGESHAGSENQCIAVRLHDGLLQILEVSKGKQTLVGFKVGSRSVRRRPVTLGLRLSGPVTLGACDLPAKFAGSTRKTVSRSQGESRCDSVALVVQFRGSKE